MLFGDENMTELFNQLFPQMEPKIEAIVRISILEDPAI